MAGMGQAIAMRVSPERAFCGNLKLKGFATSDNPADRAQVFAEIQLRIREAPRERDSVRADQQYEVSYF